MLSNEEKVLIANGNWNLELMKKIETTMKKELESDPKLLHYTMKKINRSREKKK